MGKNVTDRPVLNNMMATLKNGNISGVDVMKILDLKKTTFYKLINQYIESN